MASRVSQGMADSLHYETRHIRDALAASNARLLSARSGRPKNLQPQQGAMMLSEWQGLASMGELENDDGPAASNPQFRAMRDALLAFERDVAFAAPARERAFFAALRTQLMEAAAQLEPEPRDMQIAAAFKWFARHKPQGPEADPIAAAVLSSSLSVEQQHQHQHHQAAGSRALRSQHSGHQSATERAGSAGARGPSPEPGGKHQFFSVYSRTGAAGAPGGPGAGAAASRLPSGRGPSPGAGGAGAATGPSLSVNHPIGLHPSVSSTLGLSHRSAAGAGAGAGSGSGASGQQGAVGAPRARFAGATEMYAPGKLVRPQELDDIEHRAAQVATAAAVAAGGRLGAGGGGGSDGPAQGLHPRPWLSGPYKGAGLQAGPGSGAGGEARRRQEGRSGVAAGPGPDEDEEVRALREKWATMDARAAASVADVQNKVAEWTLQRARLEEEIVRRQEAGRFAGPVGSGAAGSWQQPGAGTHDMGLPSGTLSPYANANADLAAATAAATASTAGAGGGAVSFLLPGGGPSMGPVVSGASMRMRHADVGAYDAGRSDLVVRLARLGVAVDSDTLDRALRPVEDRPFLDCIAKLPKPGEHLVSRPGSVRLPAAKKKKKASAKKRPTSGR